LALEQQRVTDREVCAASPILAVSLHREDDQLAAARDHAGKEMLPDQLRAGWDQNLGR
jgi:hypothetical protein